MRIDGMFDPHVHLRGMDWSHKSTFASETAAAIAGGYWAVFDMPNTSPATIDRTSLDRKLNKISQDAVCDWGVYFCAAASGNWDQYPAVFTDVCGVKMFNNSTTGNLLVEDPEVRASHYQHWPPGKIFTNHAEDETLAAVLDLVRMYRKPTHILHLSTAREVDLIRQAKTEGLPVTAGVCPHHLWLTEDNLSHLGPLGWMKPTLKTKADQDALWQGLRSGVIDVVESDHAPHTLAEKSSDSPPYGVPGIETTLPLLLTAVHEGRLEIDHAIALVSENPRRIFGLKYPPDTYTVVDLDAEYEIRNDRLKTMVQWSPFDGMRVRGKVIETWIRGTQVYDGEAILVESGFGENLYG